MIAHRFSTVVSADRIIGMHAGHIIEQGAHTELLSQEGKYYHLYSMEFEE